MIQRYFYSIIVVILAGNLYAQTTMEKADKLMSLKAFDLAIKQYESIIANDPLEAECYAKLAEAYRKTHKPLEALRAYENAFQLADDLDQNYVLHYAHTLKKAGLYAQAASWYASYMETDAMLADYYINSVEEAKRLLQQSPKYDISTFAGNSEESDFGVSFYNDQIVFSSFREDISRPNAKMNDSYIQRQGNQLYSMSKAGSNSEVRFLRSDEKEVHNIGPLSYSPNGRMVAYMKNNFSKSSNWVFDDEANLSVYVAFTDDTGDFDQEQPLPFNDVNYSCAFPNISDDSGAFYFASNMPGGYGGFDLYVSYLRDGKWSKPQNLGDKINTQGNEITPYSDQGSLYFASDYLMGLGGYDIFKTTKTNGSWTKVENMGKGVNSPADEYYPAFDRQNNVYYLTSNRLGGSGKGDIYLAFPLENRVDELIAVTDADEVPAAINLDHLAAQRVAESMGESPLEMEVITDDAEPVAVPVSSTESVTIVDAEESFNIEGATRIDLREGTTTATEVDDTEYFFIQVASLTRSQGLAHDYSTLESYGNIYRFFKSNAVKIRLGYFASKYDAEQLLPRVRNAGFSDAFITRDILSVSNFELINSSTATSSYSNSTTTSGSASTFFDDYSVGSQYKVKLASYTDPLRFDVESIKDVGRIEQWTKGKWTIFVLGGFSSFDEAKKARIRAVNRGWTDAELVVDEGGILRRINER